MGNDLDEQGFQARYNALRTEYIAALPQRRAAVAEQWGVCASDPASAAWRELHTLVHRLAGSAPCYGFEDVGAAAQELDRILSGKKPCRDAATMDPLIARLLQTLDAVVRGE